MSIPKLAKAMQNIDDDLISGASEYKRTNKRSSRLKWLATAACLCLIVIGAFIASDITDNSHDYAVSVIYNDAEYIVCGEGEAEILKECGLPVEITENLAGEHLGYFKRSEKDTYYADGNKGNDSAELFEYAPQPNENVYILCIDGAYYAAIRRDSEGYHGLTDIEPSK